MNRVHGLTGLGLLLVAVAVGIWWGRQGAEPVPSPISASVPTPRSEGPSALITVHVAGWVNRPGLVEVPDGARVADAVAQAGGLLPGAAVESINLAAVVADGEQIIVSGPPGLGSTGSTASSTDGTVHLNRATAAELDALPGVGPVIAERIVAYREENGPFRSVDDLLDVPGIGEAKLADLRNRVAVP